MGIRIGAPSPPVMMNECGIEEEATVKNDFEFILSIGPGTKSESGA
jgi:hypothetical protein